ncbi:MAG: GNAT family N-acetyltransferase [Thermaerobacter sp.]|nr:GNAT family N-acetyltransferase [Thermaerobacter sp.]
MLEQRITIREVRLPEDIEALRRIDTSFETDVILRVAAVPTGFLVEPTKTATLAKAFPPDEWFAEDRLWEAGWVAIADGRIIGFAATRYESWNRRLAVWHLYVDKAARRRGIGRSLLETALAHGRRQGARSLEVSNVNAPAVRAYEARKFTLAGLDLSLYHHTLASGEVAHFMARPLNG